MAAVTICSDFGAHRKSIGNTIDNQSFPDQSRVCGHSECIPIGRMVIILSELIKLRERKKNITKRSVLLCQGLRSVR